MYKKKSTLIKTLQRAVKQNIFLHGLTSTTAL